ncbi:unnamed protein product [Phytophthora lilii]|uniref:Unnamed protein product n=1 Tax=Phytophthora lilii TaxID=2077276 RepID=A0A9W6TBE7_9STRA|nr:unnamed protein product [Phytophthora lilii]
MLGSTKPHHCFAIEGASGKHLVESAWSEEFTAMVQATYRLRLHDKMIEDEEKAKAPAQPQQQQTTTPVVSTTAGQTTTASALPSRPQPPPASVPSSAGPPATPVVANGTANSSVSAAGIVQASNPTPQEQSRKRQLPGAHESCDRAQKASQLSEHSATGGAVSSAADTSTDGMSLYDRVKALHDQRARAAQSNTSQARSPKVSMNQLLTQQNEERQRQQKEQQEREQRDAQQQQKLEDARKEQARLEREKAERIRIEQQEQERARVQRSLAAEQLRKEAQRQQELREEQRRQQEKLRRQDDQRKLEEQRQQEERRKLEEKRQQEEQRKKEEQRQLQEQQRQQRLLEERMRHEELLRRQGESRRQQQHAQALMREGSHFVSQAQHVLQAQPGYAVASMAPTSISAPMPQASNVRFVRVPSPVNVSPHAPRFQSASPSPSSRDYPFQSAPDPPVNGFIPTGNEHSAQVYQDHTGVQVPRFETISHDQGENHHLVVRDPNVQSQQQQQHQPGLSEAMVPHPMATGAGGFSPSKSGEDDELRAIWVSDYDNVNALIAQLDLEISKRTEEGHAYVHRSNNITIPEHLKLQIKQLRAQRDAAIKKRFESVVRVLIFSDAVRSFAQQNEHSNVWSDVPEVLKASHKKCAELAADIRDFERQAQKLRKGIDDAVSSGDPTQMQNVAHLGALIANLEKEIRASNGERDKQFIFMFQFSETLRNMVRAEWAAPGRGYHLQASQ